MAVASSNPVLDALYGRIEKLEDGARLPTVRELMRSFRVSQATVQQAFGRLREEGLVSSQVGRGTYVVKNGTPSPGRIARAPASDLGHFRSLLILSNASMNERCVMVQNQIVATMAGDGGKVVQISYHDTDHLLDILGSVPRFDAAILQSHYESIPIRLLHLLRQKTSALVVDGHTVAGVDIDRVGTDWEECLALAMDHLTGLGHRRIGLVTLDTDAQPILAARRAFSRLDDWRGRGVRVSPPILLRGVRHPTQSVAAAFHAALDGARNPSGRLPFTALAVLGISDTAGIRESLARLDITVPDNLSLCLLGHHDVPTEHYGVFTMAGSTQAEAAARLMEAIRRRLAEPSLPPQVVFLDCRAVIRSSTAPPAGG